MKRIKILNPHEEGVSKTIKAQYHKTSVANLIDRGNPNCYETTGVLEYEET